VNDATRLLGGTLGVAVIGSVYGSLYTGRLSAHLPAALPASLRDLAGQSVGAAYAVAQHLATGGKDGSASSYTGQPHLRSSMPSLSPAPLPAR